MNIYSTESDDFISDLRQWLRENPLDLSTTPHTKGSYSKEYHPMYGLKHTDETKQRMSVAHSGENNAMYGKRGKDNPNYGRIREDLMRINKSRAGRKDTEETKLKQSEVKKGNLNPMYGKIHSEESKLKMKRMGKNNPAFGKKYPQEKKKCEHCGLIVGKGPFKRWHGDKCKNNSIS
jgi:hypothetical protein